MVDMASRDQWLEITSQWLIAFKSNPEDREFLEEFDMLDDRPKYLRDWYGLSAVEAEQAIDMSEQRILDTMEKVPETEPIDGEA